MKNLNIKSNILLALILSVSLITSCKREDADSADFSRMFGPGTASVDAGQTQLTLTWGASLYATGKDVTYQVEFSKDESFGTINYSTTTDTSKVIVTDANLAIRTPYFVRIRTNATGMSEASKWFKFPAVQLSGEQIFTPLGTSNIIDRAVQLKWNSTPDLSKIVITRVSTGVVTEYPLTAGDNTNASKIIQNLLPGTAYTAEIFTSTKSKGFLNFSTKPTLVAFNIVDLRPIIGRPAVLEDTLAIVPSGSTILLKRGQTYNMATVSKLILNKSITLQSGDDFIPAQAELYFTSNFNFTAGAVIDSVVFKDLGLRGENATRYIFNTTGGATVNKMIFDGCKISTVRGVTRLQSGATVVTNYTVNNCVIDNVADYGVITVDNVTCFANNITIKNSTIYKTQKIITSRQNSVSVTIDGCTINEAPFGNNYLVDYSQSATNNVTAGVKLINTILGTGLNNAGTTAVRGIRVNTATGIQVTNTYKTSDYVLAALTPFPIPNLISYNGLSTDLWVAPLTGNFAFKDTGFSGKSTAGDPRWK
jgi:hypothetical protein